MAEILKSITEPKVEAIGLIDLGGMLLVKRVIDRAAMPIVGNNNIVSGGAKLLLGGFGYSVSKNRAIKIASGGMVLDGMDDVVGVIAGKIWGGGGSGQPAAVNPGL